MLTNFFIIVLFEIVILGLLVIYIKHYDAKKEKLDVIRLMRKAGRNKKLTPEEAFIIYATGISVAWHLLKWLNRAKLLTPTKPVDNSQGIGTRLKK